MGHIRSYLTSRVVATGAAVALLGGGAALANPASAVLEGQTTGDTIDNEAIDEEGEHDEEADPDSEEEVSESTEVEGSNSVAEPEPEPEDDGDQSDDPDMESDPRSSSEGQTGSTSDDGDGPIPGDSAEDVDQRSATARAVHEALTDHSPLVPGDPGFGEAVSNNARNGGNGAAVSAAVRGAGDDGAEGRGRPEGTGQGRGRPADVGPPPHAGPPDHAGRGGDREAPPSHASDEDRVGPPDHAPARGFRNANGDEDANGTDTSTDSE